jgi:DNA-binding MarR family transcriptional regulator
MASRTRKIVDTKAGVSTPQKPVWHPSQDSNYTPTFSADQHVGTALRETFTAFAQAVSGNVRSVGLTLNMWFILRSLWEHDGLTQVDLAAKLGVTPAAIVGLINGLQEQGLVARKRSETDGRAFRVFLTTTGRRVRTKATRQALQVDAKALRGFTVAEVEDLLVLMSRLRKNLSA